MGPMVDHVQRVMAKAQLASTPTHPVPGGGAHRPPGLRGQRGLLALFLKSLGKQKADQSTVSTLSGGLLGGGVGGPGLR